jgi:predicted glycosyltransferase
MPLLEIAQEKAKILCSLRDILVGQRRDQVRQVESVETIANEYFDTILIHSDKNFAN